VFALSSVNGKPGVIDGNPHQLLNQLIATAITWVFAGVMAFVLLKIVGAMVGLRPSREEEAEGLDLTQHGEAGYHTDAMQDATLIEDTV
jgi:Amt family ammonium transporter